MSLSCAVSFRQIRSPLAVSEVATETLLFEVLCIQIRAFSLILNLPFSPDKHYQLIMGSVSTAARMAVRPRHVMFDRTDDLDSVALH